MDEFEERQLLIEVIEQIKLLRHDIKTINNSLDDAPKPDWKKASELIKPEIRVYDSFENARVPETVPHLKVHFVGQIVSEWDERFISATKGGGVFYLAKVKDINEVIVQVCIKQLSKIVPTVILNDIIRIHYYSKEETVYSGSVQKQLWVNSFENVTKEDNLMSKQQQQLLLD